MRGLDQLTFDESPEAKGRRITALEALEAYGFETLAEVATEGSALICESVDAAGRVLRERRAQLDLPIRAIASETGLTPEIIEALEASKRRPIREYEKVARALGLDERMISFSAVPEGNQDVAVRLREMHDTRAVLASSAVISLAEAAWVAMTQARLEEKLALPPPQHVFQTDAFYGSSTYPAYKVGHDLADSLRAALGLHQEPLESMRDLLENDLHIPVIQADLGNRIAGATLESAGHRAIVVNVSGRNQSPFVRRSTLAHELCHLLFDPPQKLRNVRVDEYADLDEREDQIVDPVEQRASAFAAQLLAPQSLAGSHYDATADDPLASVMDRFGISFAAARSQVWNALKRARSLDSMVALKPRSEAHWEQRERGATTSHPLRSLADHPSRAGRFSAVVLRAAQQGIVSWDTAGEWLFCSRVDLELAAPVIQDLYPDLFEATSVQPEVPAQHATPRTDKKALSEAVTARAAKTVAKIDEKSTGAAKKAARPKETPTKRAAATSRARAATTKGQRAKSSGAATQARKPKATTFSG